MTEQVTPAQEESGAGAGDTLWSSLGVLRDGISAATPLVNTGFGAAQTGVDVGFAIGKFAASAPFQAAGYAVGAEDGGMAQRSVESLVDAIRFITKTSISASHEVTKASLAAGDGALEVGGVEKGEVHRLLTDYVEAQAGKEGHQVKEALLGLATLLAEVGSDMTVTNPLLLMKGASSLAVLHEEQRSERIAKRQAAEARGETLDIHLPSGSDLHNLSHYMRYAAGAYGHLAVQFLGIIPENKSRAEMLGDEACITALTGVTKRDILLVVQDGELYRPGHFVAVDRESKEIVVAIRGTMRLQDVLVDLVCESTELVSVLDEDGARTIKGKAHRGFLKSAQRLAGDLHQLVAESLESNPEYELVITGHSLGGGVATLLALLWARIPLFRSHNVRAYSYASPCSVCESISQAPFTRKHVTSVVTADDVVSRFGLATFKELQRALVTLAPLSDLSYKEKAEAYEQIPRPGPDEKLYCGGKVWWLESAEYQPHPIVEIDPVRELGSVELFADMFAIHLPNAYISSLERLEESML